MNFGKHARLIDPQAFAAYLRPLYNTKWVVYGKRPFGGPQEVLRYLARYTHRVAISNRRLIACDARGVTFKWKEDRREGRERYKIMILAPHEFIRRFLMHVLPTGFHRIRYYGLLTSGKRAENIARARELLTPPLIAVDAIKAASADAKKPQTPEHHCPCCGGRMIIRAVRTRLSPALPAEPANTSDQDRHLMIISTQSPHLTARQLSLAARLDTSRAQTNSLLVHRVALNQRFSSPETIIAKTPSALHAAQPLHLSPRATVEAARSPLKSP